MFELFSELRGLLHVSHVAIDCWVFRLHYRSGVLVGCMEIGRFQSLRGSFWLSKRSIDSVKQYVFNVEKFGNVRVFSKYNELLSQADDHLHVGFLHHHLRFAVRGQSDRLHPHKRYPRGREKKAASHFWFCQQFSSVQSSIEDQRARLLDDFH